MRLTQSVNASDVSRQDVARATRYVESEPGCRIDLSDNTNLWGAPPSVGQVLTSMGPHIVSRYPSAYSNDLKLALARYAGVDPSMIVVGCGSDDVLDSAIRSLAAPGEVLAHLDPSFSMISSFAAVSGLRVVTISPLSSETADRFGATRAGITYLCSPNNPTGAVLKPEVIEEIVATARGPVIIDEAYFEFCGQSSVRLLELYDNVLITRTMSKAFGLAAIRVGYGIGNPDLIARVEAARGPYKVTLLSECIATSVLDNDMIWVNARAADAVRSRVAFRARLDQIGKPALESGGNFVLVPVRDSFVAESHLRSRDIAVRRFAGLTGIGDALRISIGPANLMEPCIDALKEVAP